MLRPISRDLNKRFISFGGDSMAFDLVKYYDTRCDQCGNWASGDLSPQALQGTKKRVEKFLKKCGWRHSKGETVCNFCSKGVGR